MRTWLALLLLLCHPGFAAAEARRIAVVSLIGDGLLVVTREIGVGRGSEKQGRQFVALADRALDNAALLAAETAIQKADASATAVLLGIDDPTVKDAHAKATEDGAGIAPVVAALAPRIAGVQATHLLLFTRYRHDAMLRIAGGSVGSGWLEGLGFYIDRTKDMRNVKTGLRSRGFVAPFAYFTLSLAELPSGRLLGERHVYESTTVSKPDAEDPWEALGADEKVRVLQGLIRRETARAVPELLRQ